jgi:hypothetical protein
VHPGGRGRHGPADDLLPQLAAAAAGRHVHRAAPGREGQGGTLTIGIGSKAGVGPASFESGLQLTLSQHYGGTNVDLAWKTGPSAGPKSDVVDITIAKSVAAPQALPSFGAQ